MTLLEDRKIRYTQLDHNVVMIEKRGREIKRGRCAVVIVKSNQASIMYQDKTGQQWQPCTYTSPFSFSQEHDITFFREREINRRTNYVNAKEEKVKKKK